MGESIGCYSGLVSARRHCARIPDGDRRFAVATDPTPGSANTSSVSDSIVINEIYYHAFDKDPAKEFVELYNRGDEAVDVGGWSFDDEFFVVLPGGGASYALGEHAALFANYFEGFRAPQVWGFAFATGMGAILCAGSLLPMLPELALGEAGPKLRMAMLRATVLGSTLGVVYFRNYIFA